MMVAIIAFKWLDVRVRVNVPDTNSTTTCMYIQINRLIPLILDKMMHTSFETNSGEKKIS